MNDIRTPYLSGRQSLFLGYSYLPDAMPSTTVGCVWLPEHPGGFGVLCYIPPHPRYQPMPKRLLLLIAALSAPNALGYARGISTEQRGHSSSSHSRSSRASSPNTAHVRAIVGCPECTEVQQNAQLIGSL
jgi:hypothetical protein